MGECFRWLESAGTVLCFARSCAQCWSLWDGPVLLSAVVQTAVHISMMALSSYTHFALHISLLQLLFRRQLSVSPRLATIFRTWGNSTFKFWRQILQPVQHLYVIILSFYCCLLPNTLKTLETAFSVSSIAHPYKDLPLTLCQFSGRKEHALSLPMCYKHLPFYVPAAVHLLGQSVLSRAF